MAKETVGDFIDWLQRTKNGREELQEYIERVVENKGQYHRHLSLENYKIKRESALKRGYNAYIEFHSGSTGPFREIKLNDATAEDSKYFWSPNSDELGIETSFLSILAEKRQKLGDCSLYVPRVVEELTAILFALRMSGIDVRPQQLVDESRALENALEIAKLSKTAEFHNPKYTGPRDFIGVVKVGQLHTIPNKQFDLNDFLPTKEFTVSRMKGLIRALADMLNFRDDRLENQYLPEK